MITTAKETATATTSASLELVLIENAYILLWFFCLLNGEPILVHIELVDFRLRYERLAVPRLVAVAVARKVCRYD